MTRKKELLSRDALIAKLSLLLEKEIAYSTFYYWLGEAGITPNRFGYNREQVRKLLELVSNRNPTKLER